MSDHTDNYDVDWEPTYDEDHRSVWIAVDRAGTCDPAVITDVLRAAYDDVIAPVLRDATKYKTEMLVVPRGADLTAIKKTALEWPRSDIPLEAVHIDGMVETQKFPLIAQEDGGRIFKINAQVSPAMDSTGGLTRCVTRVGFSIVKGALPGCIVTGDLQRSVLKWIEQTVNRIDASAAFVTLDFATPFSTSPSPYEVAVGALPSFYDPSTQIRGYGWATVLSSSQVDQLGGLERVARTAPVKRVESLTGGRVLLVLSARINDCNELLADLRAFLAPILTKGTQPASSYVGPIPYHF